jgi:lysyl-tRNA synthetase class 2
MTKLQNRKARRQTLAARAEIIAAGRKFFRTGGYLEVETPFRIPAPAPELHINAMASGDWFLQTSPELCMKRLLADDFGPIFQFCRCWRAGERGSRHIPEFTMLEWYRPHADYRHLMVDCEGLIPFIQKEIGGNDTLVGKSGAIDLTPPWQRLTVREAFYRFGRMSMEEALARDSFDEVMVTAIEPELGQVRPTFLIDYPAERGALARLKPGDQTVAERFELYIDGLELANAFTELIDHKEQRQRFAAEEKLRRLAGKPPYPSPEPFLAQLAQMPPAAGIALGVDRLVMLLLGKQSIDEVVAFTPEEL